MERGLRDAGAASGCGGARRPATPGGLGQAGAVVRAGAGGAPDVGEAQGPVGEGDGLRGAGGAGRAEAARVVGAEEGRGSVEQATTSGRDGAKVRVLHRASFVCTTCLEPPTAPARTAARSLPRRPRVMGTGSVPVWAASCESAVVLCVLQPVEQAPPVPGTRPATAETAGGIDAARTVPRRGQRTDRVARRVEPRGLRGHVLEVVDGVPGVSACSFAPLYCSVAVSACW